MLLQKIKYGATANLDMVDIRVASMRPRVPYQVAFEIAHKLRMAAKRAARWDRQAATLSHDFMGDLNDCPAPNRSFRRSKLTSNVKRYLIDVNDGLVQVGFNDSLMEIEYEAALKLHAKIRVEARRAKAWAGDSSTTSRLLGMVTDAEEDDRLGLA